jgi:hypothetical protein
MDDEIGDPFFIVALIGMHFECDVCHAWLDDEGLAINIPDAGWDRCLAIAAKTAGWHVDTSAFEWVQLCPACARRRSEGKQFNF